MKTALGIILSFIILLNLPAFVRAIETPDYAPNAFEAEFVGYLNAYRVENGLNALTPVAELGASARHKSIDMGENDYFDHTSPDGQGPLDLMTAHDYVNPGAYGENIAAGQPSALDAFNTWVNSPGHNTNMLGVGYDHVGVGYAVVEGSTYGHYWTLHLGGDGVPNQEPPPIVDPTATPTVPVALPTETPVPLPTEAPVYVEPTATEVYIEPTPIYVEPTAVYIEPTPVIIYVYPTAETITQTVVVNQLPNTGTGSSMLIFNPFD